MFRKEASVFIAIYANGHACYLNQDTTASNISLTVCGKGDKFRLHIVPLVWLPGVQG